MQNQSTSTQRRNWPIILSVAVLLLTAFYCSISTYALFDAEGIYGIKMIGSQLVGVAIKYLVPGIYYICIPSWFILWIGLAGFSRNVGDNRIIILLALFASIFLVVGFVLGLPNTLTNLDTIYVNDKSYYLSYYYDDSEKGYFDLIECKTWGIVCSRVSIVGNGYPEIDKNAHLEIDEDTHELAVIIEGKKVYTYPLD